MVFKMLSKRIAAIMVAISLISQPCFCADIFNLETPSIENDTVPISEQETEDFDILNEEESTEETTEEFIEQSSEESFEEEIIYTYKNLSSYLGSYHIEVSGQMPEDTTIHATQLFNYEEIKEEINEDEDFEVYAAFDIELYSNGTPWQPMLENKSVDVTISKIFGEDIAPESDKDSITAYRILDDEDISEIEENTDLLFIDKVSEIDITTIDNSTILFEGEHFTTYVVGGKTITVDGTAAFINTYYFAGRIKGLVNSPANAYTYDTTIVSIEWSDDASIATDANKINIAESGGDPVYAIKTQNADNEVIIKCYTTAPKVFLINTLSADANLFYNFGAMKTCPFVSDERIDTSKAIYMNRMFCNCEALTTLDLSGWDASNVTTMSSMFSGCEALTTVGDISGWDVSNVTNMKNMFSNCEALTTLDLSEWNTQNVTTMNEMFSGCKALTTLDLSGWDASNVTTMSSMFSGCKALTTLDLSGWITQNVTDMYHMFSNCEALTTLDLSEWNTQNVTDMSAMFWQCKALTTLDLSGWNTQHVTNMSNMFWQCNSLTTLDLSGWDAPNVTNMSQMFYECNALTSLDLSGWDTSNVTNMSDIFYRCESLATLDLSEWDTSDITDMSDIFRGCESLTTLDLSGWDFSNVTTMYNMFNSCKALTTLDLSGWDVSNVRNMGWMFYNCKALTTLDLSGWNTSDVTNMANMFEYCDSLQSLDLSNFDTSNVTDMLNIFRECDALTTLDLSGWDVSNVTNMNNMFYNDNLLTTLKAPKTISSGTTINLPTAATGYSWYLDDTAPFNEPDSLDTYSSVINNVTDNSHTYIKIGKIFTVRFYDSCSFSEPQISHTPNVSDDESIQGNYANNLTSANVVTIPGASALHVKLTYGTENIYDWLVVYKGTYSSSVPSSSFNSITSLKNSANYVDGFTGKSGNGFVDGKKTVEFDVDDTDTITFIFRSDSGGSGYGYYAEVTDKSVEVEYGNEYTSYKQLVSFNNSISTPPTPTSDEGEFVGWKKGGKTSFYNMSTPVTTDLNLYAVFAPPSSPTYSILLPGNDFNSAIKTLASDATSMEWSDDSTIASDPSAVNLAVDGTAPVYAVRRTNAEGKPVIYAYSEVSTIYTNEDSSGLFEGMSKLEKIPFIEEDEEYDGIKTIDTSETTTMARMFKDCISLESISVYCFDMTNTVFLNSMFENCESLTNGYIDLSKGSESNIRDISYMFKDCENLETIDMSSFWDDNLIDDNTQYFGARYIFNGCDSLYYIYLRNDFKNLYTNEQAEQYLKLPSGFYFTGDPFEEEEYILHQEDYIPATNLSASWESGITYCAYMKPLNIKFVDVDDSGEVIDCYSEIQRFRMDHDYYNLQITDIPTASKNNSVFSHWENIETGEKLNPSLVYVDTITKDTTFIARWQPKIYVYIPKTFESYGPGRPNIYFPNEPNFTLEEETSEYFLYSRSVPYNKTNYEPNAPIWQDYEHGDNNFIAWGYYKDDGTVSKYNFSNRLTEDITLIPLFDATVLRKDFISLMGQDSFNSMYWSYRSAIDSTIANTVNVAEYGFAPIYASTTGSGLYAYKNSKVYIRSAENMFSDVTARSVNNFLSPEDSSTIKLITHYCNSTSGMFNNATITGSAGINLSSWETCFTTDMTGMFRHCSSPKVNLGGEFRFRYDSLTSIGEMFAYSTVQEITGLDGQRVNSGVVTLDFLKGCETITSTEFLENFDLRNANCHFLFNGSNIEEIIASDLMINWNSRTNVDNQTIDLILGGPHSMPNLKTLDLSGITIDIHTENNSAISGINRLPINGLETLNLSDINFIDTNTGNTLSGQIISEWFGSYYHIHEYGYDIPVQLSNLKELYLPDGINRLEAPSYKTGYLSDAYMKDYCESQGYGSYESWAEFVALPALENVYGGEDVTTIENGFFKFDDGTPHRLEFPDYENFTSDCWLNYDWDTNNVQTGYYEVSVPAAINIGGKACMVEIEGDTEPTIEYKDYVAPIKLKAQIPPVDLYSETHEYAKLAINGNDADGAIDAFSELTATSADIITDTKGYTIPLQAPLRLSFISPPANPGEYRGDLEINFSANGYLW